MSEPISQTATKPRESVRYRMVVAGILSLAAITAGALAWQTWHSAMLHRQSTERVVADYASFAAWSYQAAVRNMIFISANPIFAGADGVAQQPEPVLTGMASAADSIDRCLCGTNLSPRFVFIIDLRSGKSYYHRRDSAVTDAFVKSRTADIEQAIRISVTRSNVPSGYRSLPYRVAARGVGAGSWVSVYGGRFRDTDDPGVVVGIETSGETFAESVLKPSFGAGPLLPQSLTHRAPSEQLLAVDVRNSHGSTLFGTTPSYPRSFSATESIGGPDSALMATVSINPAVAPMLVIGGLPQSPLRTVLPFVALALAFLALAYFIVARREVDTLELKASLSEARLQRFARRSNRISCSTS